MAEVETIDVEKLQQHYVLNPSLKIVFCGEDEVLVLHGARSGFRRIIHDEGRTKTLSRVLRHMTTPASLMALHERGVLQEEEFDTALEMVDYLVQEQVLTNPEHNPVSVYLNTLYGESAPLSALSVGLVGVGYLGARVAEELMRLDVGQLNLLDDRRIEEGSVDRRQFTLIPAAYDEGRPYVDCVRDHLSAFGYDRVESIEAPSHDREALEALFDTSHFVIAASEVFASRLFHTVDMVAIAAEKPWMSAYMDGSEACIGPLYIPGETCCYNEFEIQCEASLSISKVDYYAYKEAESGRGLRSTHFVMPAYLSTVSGLVVSAATTFLAYGQSHLVGRCLRMNFEKPYVDYEEVLRLPRSPASASTRNGYRHTFM